MWWRTVLAAIVATFATVPAPAAVAPDLARGAYVATMSDCEACHTAPGGKPLAGGLPIESPIGTIYATNITPSTRYGIGRYTLAQFTALLREGRRPDGSHVYPAMPYTSYAKLTDPDIASLYAYLRRGVAPVDVAPTRTTKLPFPYGIRMSMAAWNLLFHDARPYVPDPARSAQWNRGAYLVQGATHCGECHTPRGIMMEQRKGQMLGGAVIGSWYAPEITSDRSVGVGAMSDDELFRYLKYGRVAHKAQAGGEMALAVQLSFSRMTDEDLRAIVAYLRTVPAIAAPDARAKFAQGAAVTDVASFRGIAGRAYDTPPPGGAAQRYAANCASCHGIAGQGSRDGYYPSLWHNSALATGGGRNLVAAILFGIRRETAEGLAFMPGFGGRATDIAAFDDAEVAQIANYVLHRYGDPDLKVTTALVAQVRAGRTPTPPIVILVTAGEIAAGLAVVAAVAWLMLRRRRGGGRRAA